MRDAQALTWPPRGDPGISGPPRRTVRAKARLRAPWLDRSLAGGIASWRSPLHAARALQLTSERSRRRLARSLERLAEHARQSPGPFRGAEVTPCREQVSEALPVIVGIATLLRSGDPVDARGIARLKVLLADGAGPCYIKIRPNALTNALHETSEWLTVPA
jgi:hypothetical protein